jgi:hypothetical protein
VLRRGAGICVGVEGAGIQVFQDVEVALPRKGSRSLD